VVSILSWETETNWRTKSRCDNSQRSFSTFPKSLLKASLIKPHDEDDGLMKMRLAAVLFWLLKAIKWKLNVDPLICTSASILTSNSIRYSSSDSITYKYNSKDHTKSAVVVVCADNGQIISKIYLEF
jgi:hypothetical protein